MALLPEIESIISKHLHKEVSIDTLNNTGQLIHNRVIKHSKCYELYTLHKITVSELYSHDIKLQLDFITHIAKICLVRVDILRDYSKIYFQIKGQYTNVVIFQNIYDVFLRHMFFVIKKKTWGISNYDLDLISRDEMLGHQAIIFSNLEMYFRQLYIEFDNNVINQQLHLIRKNETKK